MRFGELRSIAHNVADSLASGYSQLVGMYELDVFGEAASSPQGFIDVDFLAGTAPSGPVSTTLNEAISRFREALPDLCKKHHVSEAAFRQLKARCSTDGASATFVVTVEDVYGRTATDTYVGNPGARPRIVDNLGRIRTSRPSAKLVSR
ncbi:hypothetical protein [Muricoccus nepalensis]|uniref:hypothetical protein n=1 Tax=Muricoccus nepalensis TaxID=1854500 RepID=UPI00112C1979|nr:hypothetical protein [Roseomonas nepalensis]